MTQDDLLNSERPHPHPLRLPPGTKLEEGKLYLHLFHGRDDPQQDMDGWGFDGPCFGPLAWFHLTYAEHQRGCGLDMSTEIELEIVEGMVKFEGKYYGDWSLFIAGGDRGKGKADV